MKEYQIYITLYIRQQKIKPPQKLSFQEDYEYFFQGNSRGQDKMTGQLLILWRCAISLVDDIIQLIPNGAGS